MKMYEIEWKYKIYNTINISFVAGRNTRAAIKSFLDVTKKLFSNNNCWS